MSRQAYWLNQDTLDELYPSYAIHSLVNEFRFRGVLVPVDGALREETNHEEGCRVYTNAGGCDCVEVGEEQT